MPEEYLDNIWKSMCEELDKLELDDDGQFINSEIVNKFTVSPPIVNIGVCAMETIAHTPAFPSLQNPSVLEIGGGYGNFCHIFNHILGYKDYTILDTNSMLRVAKKFHEITQIQCNYIPTEDYISLKEKKFDLLVANVCLSEIPYQHVLNILECVAKNCSRLFIIDADYKIVDNLSKIFDYLHQYFEIKQVKDFVSLQKNSFIYLGRKKYV